MLRQRRAEIAAIRRDCEQLALFFTSCGKSGIRGLGSDLMKFNPDQPRVPAGNPDGGRWTGGAGKSTDDADLKEIFTRAKQLAIGRASMNRCIDLCYPLLERLQPAGSDRNEFDFRKCLNECLD